MSLEYTWTRDNLKAKLHRMRRIPNLIFLGLGVLFYVYFTWYGITEDIFDTKIILLGFVVYFMILIIFLLLTTKLYVFINLLRNDRKTSKAYGTYYISADDKGINSKINNEKIAYEWKEISKFKKGKSGFFLATDKDKLGLRFDKNCLNEEKYTQLLKYVEDKLAKV